MRNELGQYVKGFSSSPKTQFKKGQRVRLGIKHTEATKEKLRQANYRRKPMTNEQRIRWGKLHSGKNNGNWKGGINLEHEKVRKSIDYRDWRKSVFIRDHFHCRVCCADGYMNAHHIKPFRDNEKLRNDINNGITVCIECHKIMFKREYLFINYLQGILENGFNSVEHSQESIPSQQERLRKALWACVTVKGE